MVEFSLFFSRFLPVGEVCPHALAFSVKHAQKPDCLGKTVPFLR
jgi:hypothetical protein